MHLATGAQEGTLKWGKRGGRTLYIGELLFCGALTVKALLAGVSIRAPDFANSHLLNRLWRAVENVMPWVGNVLRFGGAVSTSWRVRPPVEPDRMGT